MATGNGRLANESWEALFRAHTTLMKRFTAADVWQGITMREYDVLYTLSKCPGPIRLSELHRRHLLSQPALSRMVDRLVERGLVARTTDPHDGRGVRLALTDAGRAEQRRVGGRHAVDVARAMTARLTEEEMETLQALCRRLSGEDTPADPSTPRDEEYSP
ncbi:DNA-binding MarR family transcriptional regulator [Stackebrandtia albiflava]|uniref:DNA-binding MarR family transcriptional regulator n=1 Tax=Stackebrandtia albiflava TaxID=406432 RepID=A0A562UQE1_9ACTN|nr:MarR family transcriptional regulator [Stackebrandtia albiflava]TWJ07828.1 DNA-binding MarR family transcriptional regulator [Stackebrandtia albiflava]